MWSIDYLAETAEEQTESMEGGSVDPASSSVEIDKEKDEHTLSVQNSEEAKSESEVKSESETKTELEPHDREAAIKRVEELVKQMSLSQDNGGGYYDCIIFELLIISENCFLSLLKD